MLRCLIKYQLTFVTICQRMSRCRASYLCKKNATKPFKVVWQNISYSLRSKYRQFSIWNVWSGIVNITKHTLLWLLLVFQDMLLENRIVTFSKRLIITIRTCIFMMCHIKSVHLLNIMLKTLFVSFIHTLILSSRASIYFVQVKSTQFLTYMPW